jgi:hypothetical protein
MAIVRKLEVDAREEREQWGCRLHKEQHVYRGL